MEIGAELRDFILSQPVARLATVDRASCPHIVPICFALEGDMIYSPIDEKPKRATLGPLRRLRNIDANPHVQVLVDRYDDDWRSLRYVQLRGRASVIHGGEEHARAVELLRRRYSQYALMDLDSRPVIAVRIDRVVSWSFAPEGS